MIGAVLKDGLADLSSTQMLMWQTVLEYQMESFFLLICRRLDLGLAVLRMAAELARDIARIGGHHNRLDIWLSRGKGKMEQKRYQEFMGI